VLTGEVNVPQDQQLTFYTRHGEWFAECCACVALLTTLGGFGRRWIGRSAGDAK